MDYILHISKSAIPKHDIKQQGRYPGADCSSDHNLVVTRLRMRMKKITKEETSREAGLDKHNKGRQVSV